MNDFGEIDQAAEWRKLFDSEPMCSLLLEDHTFVLIKFKDIAVAVICSDCGRYPLEVMSHWEGVGGAH